MSLYWLTKLNRYRWNKMTEKQTKSLDRYRDSLDLSSKRRYDEKLALIDKRDPYTVEKSMWTNDVEKWAGVSYPDIVNFLLYTTSAYTLDEMRSYKGLEAYNQFVSGWVREVMVFEINGVCVHTARVMHSQRLSEAALTPWAIIQKEGKVLAAHCNCMAGLGEACVHIAAMLFSIEATVKVRESRTVTQCKSYWLPSSVKGVEQARIENIDFTSAKTMKKTMDAQFSDTPITKRGSMQHKPMELSSENEISVFLQQLKETGEGSSILSVKSAFQLPFVPKVLDRKYPKVLSTLINNDLLSANYSEIMKYCENVHVQVTKEESDSVQLATKKQSECKLWNRFRSGRITASRMYAVCHSSPAAPSESLIRAICNPESVKFVTAATKWGCSHEKDARVVYSEVMEALHDNFIVEDAGFAIHPDYPVFGASPDALCCCDCCGLGVVEIKCPYSSYCVRSSTLDTYSGSNSCLEENPYGRSLKRNHPYFYQIQSQIHVCGREYADLVVWTEKEVHIERIEPQVEFWNEISRKASNFHSMAIMPELVGKFFSRLNQPAPLSVSDINIENQITRNSDVFCICRQGETDTMVACDNENCPYQWFHLQCLKLSESKLPKGKWYCPDCSRLPEFRTKKRCIRK